MGADLILAHLDVTDLWDDPDRARAELNRRIDAVTEPADWFDEEGAPDEVLDAWRIHLRDRIEFIFEVGARDAVVIEVAGRTILITGGTSWGDSPSEALDALTDLDEAGILAEPWPRKADFWNVLLAAWTILLLSFSISVGIVLIKFVWLMAENN
jgi:hypothetical protein